MLSLLVVFGACSKAPSDEAISSAIKASYFSDPQLKNEPITIAVNNGEVTLPGKYPTTRPAFKLIKSPTTRPESARLRINSR